MGKLLPVPSLFAFLFPFIIIQISLLGSIAPDVVAPQDVYKSIDWVLETVAPATPPEETSTNEPQESFSACILTMDDYPGLTEWIAYHYHALPLRHMIVAVDPRSSVSPTPIFDLWRAHGMTIEEWSDEQFYPEGVRNPLPDDASNKVKYNRHLSRQKQFYQACINALRRKNRTWTTLHDTDEYLRFNSKAIASGTFGVIPEPLPSVEQPGAILQFIKAHNATQFTNVKGWEKWWTTSCITIPRMYFVPKESSVEEQRRFEPTSLENISKRLDTQMFRYNTVNWKGRDGRGKCMVDVSRIPPILQLLEFIALFHHSVLLHLSRFEIVSLLSITTKDHMNATYFGIMILVVARVWRNFKSRRKEIWLQAMKSGHG